MTTSLEILAALALFCVGLKLSAFFSGSETGFYRVSLLRLRIDDHAGDRVAGRILWFTRNPSHFVATTLVGNNVANWITTLAIGIGVAAVHGGDPGWPEIAATLLLAPLVFIAGELIPKSLSYRAPMTMLRRDSFWFRCFYFVFLPISLPLVWLTKLIERFGRREAQPVELVLGRSRLAQVLSQGHRAGLLTDVQNRMVNGLMHTAAQTVRDSLTPASRILGIADDADRDAILAHARRFGLSHIPVRRSDTTSGWYAYLRVADVRISRNSPQELLRTLTITSADANKLEALLALRTAGETHGIVSEGDTVVGLVSERGLIEQLFRSPQAGVSA